MSHMRILSFVMILSHLSVAASGFAQPPRTVNCTASEILPLGQRAPDSIVIAGQRLPRTASALGKILPEPGGFVRFYPGERVVVGLGSRRVGTAVFDGCTLVREWRDGPAFPSIEAISQFELSDPLGVPAQFRDPAGYRVFLIAKWDSLPPPASKAPDGAA